LVSLGPKRRAHCNMKTVNSSTLLTQLVDKGTRQRRHPQKNT
jgi:hypothetical protein